MGRKDLDFKEEFLLFQLSRIRLLRESSTSISAGEKLTAIKIASNDIILKLRSFWERADCNLALINQWVKQLASVTTQWQEAIDDFPNSLVLRDTYITFLIEAGSRYSDAVYQKSRADLLDNGINFQVGMDSYKRFIAKYPQYLKKRILDVRGNLMNKGRSGRAPGPGESMMESSGSSGAGSTSASDQAHGMLDAGMEEGIGQNILNQGSDAADG